MQTGNFFEFSQLDYQVNFDLLMILWVSVFVQIFRIDPISAFDSAKSDHFVAECGKTFGNGQTPFPNYILGKNSTNM